MNDAEFNEQDILKAKLTVAEIKKISESNQVATVEIPEDAGGRTLHLIRRDKGKHLEDGESSSLPEAESREHQLEPTDGGEELPKPPTYLQLPDKVREKEITMTLAELHSMIYQFDWIEILREAVEARPTSWGVQKDEEHAAVAEWRNATDELIFPVWKRLFQELWKEDDLDD